ncbi:hypothetical protein GCM10023191_005780 [Actinoallomurus oryzae]|uniref:NB-ARC domain-containing protein n=1 Tax=Actinoallomurus oryzae TaxID=502180 RepID=A0ABP8PBV8_9ACTN
MGKTTLAVHWAHQVRERFPDGDLFVNLRGYDPGQPVTPEQALDGFLRALDVPAEKIPSELDAQAALFRSLLDARRMLVVLDNAASVQQVRPLLPGAAGCLTLITSRSQLSGLATREGVGRVSIDVLSPGQALRLLRQVIGSSRVDAEPSRAAELARYCGYLPLALRIAADRAVTHPYLTLADLVEELIDEHDRLDMLASDDDAATAVRAVFSWSYNRLSPDAARVFRLLGLNTGSDLSAEAAVALTGLTKRRACRLLDTLAGQHLLQQTGRSRYGFHDLLRVYAAERAMSEESEGERSVAVGRMLNWYLHTTLAARRIVHPIAHETPIDPPNPAYPPLTFASHDRALDWCEQERVNLVAAIQQAAEDGHEAIAWKLADNLASFFALAWYPDDWITILRIGLTAARHLADQNAQAIMLMSMADFFYELKRYDEAIDNYQQALLLSRETGTRWIEGFCLNGLGISRVGLRQFDEAAHYIQQALAIFRETGMRHREAIALNSLGSAYHGLGRPNDAISCHLQAIPTFEQFGADRRQAYALGKIGDTYYDLRQFRDAVYYHRKALQIFRKKKDRRSIAFELFDIGKALHADRQTDAARRSWEEALAIFSDLGDPLAGEIRSFLADLADDSDEP